MGHKIQRAVDTSTNVCKYFVIEERNRICQATNHVWKENIKIRLPQIYHKQIKISACWSKFHYKPSYTPPERKFSLWFKHLISAPENVDSDYFADFKSINFSAYFADRKMVSPLLSINIPLMGATFMASLTTWKLIKISK